MAAQILWIVCLTICLASVVHGFVGSSAAMRRLSAAGMRPMAIPLAAAASSTPEPLDSLSAACRMLKEYDEMGAEAIPLREIPEVKLPPPLSLAQARSLISQWKTTLIGRGEATDIFGLERGHQFDGSFNAIYQTFGGAELYPTIEDKAANLVYFIIKDEPFMDGNKRIGLVLFEEFLRLSGRPIDWTAITLAHFAVGISKSNPADRDKVVADIVERLFQ